MKLSLHLVVEVFCVVLPVSQKEVFTTTLCRVDKLTGCCCNTTSNESYPHALYYIMSGHEVSGSTTFLLDIVHYATPERANPKKEFMYMQIVVDMKSPKL